MYSVDVLPFEIGHLILERQFYGHEKALRKRKHLTTDALTETAHDL